MEKVIFAVMGPSGGGKTTLINEMLRRFPEDLAPMKSLTTRPKRSAEDDLAYKFVTREEFIALRDAGGLIQCVEYDGNFYGDERGDIAAIFASGRHGIRPMVADGIRNFRAAGFRVAVANVIPAGDGYKNRSAERQKIDAARAKDPLLPDLDIENRFEPGGFERTCDSLAAFIRGYLAGLTGR
ncbi:MAG TPA: hypothetical protein VL426_02350 [Candidatus Binatia bacterium]|jgi:guanylate kinase|nr:hypothetical protein [Candidatus Binatia bacterium]